MNFLNEFGLLVVVAIPVLAILGLQVFLFASGERGTLLLPGMDRYPSIPMRAATAEASVKLVSVNTSPRVAAESSNDAMERKAA